MNREEAGQLLAIIAMGDNRHIAPEHAVYWQNLLADIRLEDAAQAVATHRRESAEYLQPAHIVRLVRIERSRRTANIVYEPVEGETGREFCARVGALYRTSADAGQARTIGAALELGTGAKAPAEIEAATSERRAVRMALSVRCPACHAAPRVPCRIGRNANGRPGFAHPGRIEAARAAGAGGLRVV